MTIPFPLAIWDEPQLSGAPSPLTRLVPWKRTDGFWVLLPVGTVAPTGAVQGAWVHGTFDLLTTSTTVGLRHTRNPSGVVFSY